jgi:hypothetical protein
LKTKCKSNFRTPACDLHVISDVRCLAPLPLNPSCDEASPDCRGALFRLFDGISTALITGSLDSKPISRQANHIDHEASGHLWKRGLRRFGKLCPPGPVRSNLRHFYPAQHHSTIITRLHLSARMLAVSLDPSRCHVCRQLRAGRKHNHG